MYFIYSMTRPMYNIKQNRTKQAYNIIIEYIFPYIVR